MDEAATLTVGERIYRESSDFMIDGRPLMNFEMAACRDYVRSSGGITRAQSEQQISEILNWLALMKMEGQST